MEFVKHESDQILLYNILLDEIAIANIGQSSLDANGKLVYYTGYLKSEAKEYNQTMMLDEEMFEFIGYI